MPCSGSVRPAVPSVAKNPEIQPPVVIKRVEPRIPSSLLGATTTASVEAVIGEDGRARDFCIASGDPQYGRALIEALRRWEFKPATLDGKPTAVLFTLSSSLRR